jgi:hypothetical protein
VALLKAAHPLGGKHGVPIRMLAGFQCTESTLNGGTSACKNLGIPNGGMSAHNNVSTPGGSMVLLAHNLQKL